MHSFNFFYQSCMSLSLRKVEILAALAETGSVSLAAKKLHLTQSAISMALAGMEKEAGAPLFRRTGRTLSPNERGRLLLPLANEVLAAQARLEECFAASGPELRGELRIGASTTIANYLLPGLLAGFARAHPGVRLAMEVGNTGQIAAALEAGALDLACVEGPVRSKNLKIQHWRDDRLAVVTAPGHPWTKAAPGVAELAAAPWIMREEGSGTREVFQTAMRAAGLSPNVLMELGHTEAIKKAVEANLGVGCLSILAVARELAAGTLAEVATPLDLSRALTLLSDERQPPSKIAAACMKALTNNN